MELCKRGNLYLRNCAFKEDFDKLCKKYRWKKNKLFEQVIKNLIFLEKTGLLDERNRNIPITLTTSSFVCKS